MTKDEFIDAYLERSGISQYRTPDGYSIEGRGHVALPCACGEEGCDGWAMICDDPVNILDHRFFNGPNEGHPAFEELLEASRKAERARFAETATELLGRVE